MTRKPCILFSLLPSEKVDEGDLHLFFLAKLRHYIHSFVISGVAEMAGVARSGGITAMNKFHPLYCPENQCS
jgi:hypothetical protein